MVDRKRVNSVPYLESFPVDNRVRLYYSIFFFFPLSLNYPHARMRQSGSFQFSTKRGLEKGGGGGAGGGGGGGGGGISQGGGDFRDWNRKVRKMGATTGTTCNTYRMSQKEKKSTLLLNALKRYEWGSGSNSKYQSKLSFFVGTFCSSIILENIRVVCQFFLGHSACRKT